MMFYVFVKGCSIIAPLTIETQCEKLNAVRLLIESGVNNVAWEQRDINVNNASDVYNVPISGFMLAEYLNETIAPLVEQNGCEVYW